MKTLRFNCLHSTCILLFSCLSLLALPAYGASLFTLAGTTPDARYDTADQLKLSVIEWSADEEVSAILSAYDDYVVSGDESAFTEFLEDQPTRGYLFTGEVTGYSIKYAVPLDGEDMALLIVPGLKSKNRYMWDPARPAQAPGFTLLEVRWQDDGASAELLTSLGGEISQGPAGLVLQEGAHEFGQLEDATPYYLKDKAS